jgi:hypothetical protein
MELIVAPTGRITTLYTETLDLAALGPLQITRASRVEPDEQGRWCAQLVDGPTLGPFAKRSTALVAEVAWLTAHRLHGAD